MRRKHLYPNASAEIQGGVDNPKLLGQVNFYQKENGVLVEAFIEGLPKTQSGFFGFHIHEGNSCTGNDFSNTGNHYNPKNTPHPNHTGDLPPLIYCQGGAYQAVLTDRFQVSDIIGKTVVIHDSPDDFTTQPSGNAGVKIACGEIK